MRSQCAGTYLSVPPEHLLHLTHPPHVEPLRKINPYAAHSWSAHKRAVLCAEADARQVAQVLLKKNSIAPGYDVNYVPRVSGEFLEGFEYRWSWDGHARGLNDWGEGALRGGVRNQQSI